MRISGVTYAVRKRSRKITFLRIFIVLIFLAIAASAVIHFFIGWPLPFVQKAFDIIDGIFV